MVLQSHLHLTNSATNLEHQLVKLSEGKFFFHIGSTIYAVQKTLLHQ